ncbi:MAG: radical SAM protein [Desulfocapsaceae bacterium]|nr:radical SAM protein [Desulfocapsaceae bacterium]
MKIRLISLTPTGFPNLALMKISAFHKACGDEVSTDEPDPDKVYISSPFSQYKNACDYSKMFPDAEIKYGGYGFSDVKLPDSIEHLMPDYSIFNCDRSMGFTTRGCIRNCWFCVVPKNEGNIRKNSPVQEFHHTDHDTIVLLDNNILYYNEWFMQNSDYILKNNLKVHIESGIDIRLVTNENAKRLEELRHQKRLHFAFDDLKYEQDLRRGIELLEGAGIKKRDLTCYILAWPGGFDDAWRRQEIIWKEYGIDPFIQVYNNSRKDPSIRKLARWCNLPQIRKSCEFSEYKRKITTQKKMSFSENI